MKTYYKPNSYKTGCMASFSIGGEGTRKGVFLTMKRQTGWDEKGKTGSFKGGEEIKVKLDYNEINEMIKAINNWTIFKTPHFKDSVCTNIGLGPKQKKEGDEWVSTKDGFSLKINKVKEKQFLVNFEAGDYSGKYAKLGDLEGFKNFLEFASNRLNELDLKEDMQKAKEFKKKQQEN